MICNISPETADCFGLLDCFGKLMEIVSQIYRRLARHPFKMNFNLNLNCTKIVHQTIFGCFLPFLHDK